MATKNFALRIAGLIFGVVSILHLLRILTGVSVIIGTWVLPLWINYMGLVVTGFLCGWLWWLSFRKARDSGNYITNYHRY